MTTSPRARLLRIEITPLSLLYVLAAIAAVWLFLQLWVIGLLLVVTLVFVGTLNPVVESLEKRGMSRMRALVFVFGVLSVTAVVLFVLTVPSFIEQVAQAAADAPEQRLRLIAFLGEHSETAPLGRIIRDAAVQ